MAEPATIQPINTNKSLPLGHSYVRGRVVSARKVKTLFITVLRLPAPKDDEYGFPPSIEICSSSLLAKPNEEWEGQVRLSGVGRRVTPKPDPETGEIRDSYASANNQLWAVE